MKLYITMNTNIFLMINSWAGKNEALDAAMIFSAHYLIYILFAIAAGCIGYLTLKKQWREVILFCATLGVAFGILLIASQLYISDRPFVHHEVTQLIEHVANQSFPSDHATGSITIALAILVFTRFKKIGWMLVVMAVMIGFARIFTGVHYPFDVVGGILTGLFGTVIVYSISRHLRISTTQKQTPHIDTE